MRRILGYDLARCLAILGMVWVNYEIVFSFGASGPGWLRLLADGVEGRAAALFVTLAGIGVTLLDNRVVLLKRAGFLLVLGYLWQLVWPGDILHYYAFYLVFAAAFLRARPAVLWVAAAVSLLAFVVMFQFLDYGAGWRWRDLSYPEFWSPLGQLRNLLFNGWHPLFPWLAFLFTGMALGRMQLHRSSTRRPAMVVAAGLFLVSWLVSSQLSGIADARPIGEQAARWFEAPESFFGLSSMPPGPFYVLSAASSSAFIIALCLEVTDRPIPPRWIEPFAATGQMALTIYLAHVLVGIPDLDTLSEPLPLTVPLRRALLFCGGAILVSWLWRKRFRHGPLEWAMRSLSRTE